MMRKNWLVMGIVILAASVDGSVAWAEWGTPHRAYWKFNDAGTGGTTQALNDFWATPVFF